MQLVNCPNETSGPSTLQADFKAHANTHQNSLVYWIPGLILVAMISGISLLGSTVTPKDEINWLTRLAESGNSGAQLQIGLAYRDGQHGLASNPKRGFYWLKRAAENGNVYAEDTLASMYATGTGTEQDLSVAMKWWKKAMHDGSPTAHLHLTKALIRSSGLQQTEDASSITGGFKHTI